MFEAILLLSYGGPESPEEVLPFIEQILKGKRAPSQRIKKIEERYLQFGGVSPLNSQCRQFKAQIEQELRAKSHSARVYWGNLYANPTLDEALGRMEADGIKSALVFPSSAFGSPQSCAHYRQTFRDALSRRSEAFVSSLNVVFVPPFFDLPATRRLVADGLLDALARLDLEQPESLWNEKESQPTRLILFTAHSIPSEDGKRALYQNQLVFAAFSGLQLMITAPSFGGNASEKNGLSNNALGSFPQKRLSRLELSNYFDFKPIQEALNARGLDAALAFQSRSGSPHAPWLEPNAVDFVKEYKKTNPQLKGIVASPIGFFFENMETIYDLDVELKTVCDELDVAYKRKHCWGASPRFAKTFIQITETNADEFPVCNSSMENCDLSCKFADTPQ